MDTLTAFVLASVLVFGSALGQGDDDFEYDDYDHSNETCSQLSTCSSCVSQFHCEWRVADNVETCEYFNEIEDVNTTLPYMEITVRWSTEACSKLKCPGETERGQPAADPSLESKTAEDPTTSVPIRTTINSIENVDAPEVVDGGGVDDERAVVEEDNPPVCSEDSFDTWTMLGGIFLGIGVTIIGQLCHKAYTGKRKANYNEPYRFDDFVNA